MFNLFSALLLLCSFLVAPMQAHAHEKRILEEVSIDHLTLLGKPIKNRVSGEILALSCKSDTQDSDLCEKMQFVLILGQSAFRIGIEFTNLEETLKKTGVMLEWDTHETLRIEGMSSIHTKNGWNWSVISQKVSHRKFYYYKRAIDLMVDKTWGPEKLLVNTLPAIAGQCRMNLLSNCSNLLPEDRMERIHEIIIAREVARLQNCALTTSDVNAEYQLHLGEINNFLIDPIGNQRQVQEPLAREVSITVLDTKTKAVIHQSKVRLRGYHPKKQDKKISRLLVNL